MIDFHQHIWTSSLLDALAARTEVSCVRRDDGLTVLHSANEQPYVIDLGSEQPAHRRHLRTQDGLDAAIVAISPNRDRGAAESCGRPRR